MHWHERTSTFSFWEWTRWKTGLLWSMWAGAYLYQTTLCEGLPVCKILQTRVINVSCCLWKSQALGVPPPCTIWKPLLAPRDWHIRRSGLLPAYFASFAWLVSLNPHPSLLYPIVFPSVKGFGRFFCFVLTFFFLFTKTHLSSSARPFM